MDGVKGEDYIPWTMKLVFGGEIDETAVRILEDYGAEEIERHRNTVYFN